MGRMSREGRKAADPAPSRIRNKSGFKGLKCRPAPVSLGRLAMDQGANPSSPFLLFYAVRAIRIPPACAGAGILRNGGIGERAGSLAPCRRPALLRRKRREAKAGRPWLAAPPCLRAPCGSAMRRQSGIKIRSGFKGWKCRSAQVPPRPYAMETEAK